jgi:hypothetical protein
LTAPARRVAGCLLPIGAVIAVITLPFTAGIEGICVWNFVQFGHACWEGNTWQTILFMAVLLPFPLVGIMFVVARFVSALTTADKGSDRYSDPNP